MFDISKVLQPGVFHIVKKTLTEADTAARANYGGQELGYLIGSHVYHEMLIDASVKLIGGKLPSELVTVGRMLEITLNAPSCPNMTLRVKSTLRKIEGDRLYFEMEAWDDCGYVAQGKHERTIVNKAKLLERANQRLLANADYSY